MYSSVASSIAPERIPKNLHFAKKFFANENFAADTGQFTQLSVGTAGSFAVTGGQGVITNASGSAKDRYVMTGTAPTITTFIQATVAARSGSPSANDAVGIGIIKDSNNLILFEYDRISAKMHFAIRIGGVLSIKAEISGLSTIATSYKIAISIFKNRLTGFVDTGSAEGWTQKITYDMTSLLDLTATDLSTWRCGFGVFDSGSATATTSFDDFIAMRRINYFDVQPPGLVEVNETFTTNVGQFTQFTAGTAGTFSFTGGKGQIVHGVSDTSTFEAIGAEVQLPQFFASLDIVSMTGSGSRLSVGLVKDATHFILARYSTLDGNFIVRISDGTNNVNSGVSISYTAPFKIGFSVVGNSCVCWVDQGNGWERATGVDCEATFDLKSIVKAGGGYKAAMAMTSNGSATTQFDNLVFGRFGGIAIRDETFVTYEDGTAYTSGNLCYFTGSASDTQEQTPHGGTYCATFSLDLTTYAITQLGAIMVNRSSKIQNDHAGHLIKYLNGDSRLLISSWGDSLTAAPLILQKLEASVDLLNGTHVVSSMATITISLANNGYYDPCMVKIGSTYYMAYTKSPYLGTDFHPCIDTSTNLTSWTNLLEDSANTPFEGTKIFKADGRFWMLAGGNAVSRIYNLLTGAFVANLDANMVSVNTYPHPAVVPLGKTQNLITFDDTRYVPAKLFTWGHVQIHQAPRYK